MELEALHDQLHRKGHTAQVATYEAHKDRLRWEDQGGEPPVQSPFGKVPLCQTSDLHYTCFDS